MNVQRWLNQHTQALWFIIPAYVFVLWVGVGITISYIGGWHKLTKRFRTTLRFDGVPYKMQSGSMRLIGTYGNCLTIGANHQGLYLATLFLFRAGHPALFIPWKEIRVGSSRSFLLFERRTLRVGSAEDIPLTISENLAVLLREDAGGSWPFEDLAL